MDDIYRQVTKVGRCRQSKVVLYTFTLMKSSNGSLLEGTCSNMNFTYNFWSQKRAVQSEAWQKAEGDCPPIEVTIWSARFPSQSSIIDPLSLNSRTTKWNFLWSTSSHSPASCSGPRISTRRLIQPFENLGQTQKKRLVESKDIYRRNFLHSNSVLSNTPVFNHQKKSLRAQHVLGAL